MVLNPSMYCPDSEYVTSHQIATDAALFLLEGTISSEFLRKEIGLLGPVPLAPCIPDLLSHSIPGYPLDVDLIVAIEFARTVEKAIGLNSRRFTNVTTFMDYLSLSERPVNTSLEYVSSLAASLRSISDKREVGNGWHELHKENKKKYNKLLRV